MLAKVGPAGTESSLQNPASPFKVDPTERTSRSNSAGRADSLSTRLLPLSEGEGADEGTKNQLGTLEGCYIPCLLNILGAILFLRIAFAIGARASAVQLTVRGGIRDAS